MSSKLNSCDILWTRRLR